MRNQKTLDQRTIWMRGIVSTAVMVLVFYFGAITSLAAEGKVKADTAKIRAEANTTSEVVGSTTSGKTIDILEAVKDSAGTVWYKVPVGNNVYGYIRSDLVETTDKIEPTDSSTSGAAGSSGSESQGSESTVKPADTVPTAIGEQQATVSQASVRIRSGASTKHDTVASLPKGTVITLIGEANDSSGNKWYQLTCNYNNKTVEGYVRSDLITIGASGGSSSNEGESTGEPAEGEPADAEGTEGENPEGENPEGDNPEGESQEPVVNENNDYEVKYTQNESGEYAYYLYDNINGTMQKLSDLLGVVDTANASIDKLEGQAQNSKIIIIILAVVIVILVVTVTILIFKIRDLSYEDYDEEDEEEEEEEPVVVRKKVKKRVIEEEEPEPVRRKRPVSQEQASARERSARPVSSKPSSARPAGKTATKPRTSGEAELRAVEKKSPVRKPESRKAQNFLVDDDEFEFEFLNMDDKDL